MNIKSTFDALPEHHRMALTTDTRVIDALVFYFSQLSEDAEKRSLSVGHTDASQYMFAHKQCICEMDEYKELADALFKLTGTRV